MKNDAIVALKLMGLVFVKTLFLGTGVLLTAYQLNDLLNGKYEIF